MFFKQILQREFKKVIAFLSLLIKIRQFICNKTMVFPNDSIRIKKTHVHTCNTVYIQVLFFYPFKGCVIF